MLHFYFQYLFKPYGHHSSTYTYTYSAECPAIHVAVAFVSSQIALLMILFVYHFNKWNWVSFIEIINIKDTILIISKRVWKKVFKIFTDWKWEFIYLFIHSRFGPNHSIIPICIPNILFFTSSRNDFPAKYFQGHLINPLNIKSFKKSRLFSNVHILCLELQFTQK